MLKKIKNLLPILLILLACSFASSAQTVEPQDEKICISREAAEKASKAFDVVKSQEKEIAELKNVLAELKIRLEAKNELLKLSDEEKARMLGIINELIKNPRRQIKIGIITF